MEFYVRYNDMKILKKLLHCPPVLMVLVKSFAGLILKHSCVLPTHF